MQRESSSSGVSVPVAEIASAKVQRQNLTGLFKGYGMFRTQCNWSTEEGHMGGIRLSCRQGQSREGLVGVTEPDSRGCRGVRCNKCKGAGRPRPVPHGPKIT